MKIRLNIKKIKKIIFVETFFFNINPSSNKGIRLHHTGPSLPADQFHACIFSTGVMRQLRVPNFAAEKVLRDN